MKAIAFWIGVSLACLILIPLVSAQALVEAAKTGNLPVVRQLLTQGENPNLADSIGRTALMKASEEGHLEVVESLLRAGA